jgi:hypothetical protein
MSGIEAELAEARTRAAAAEARLEDAREMIVEFRARLEDARRPFWHQWFARD